MKKNRGAAFGRPLCVSIVLHFVVDSVVAAVVASVVASVLAAVVAAVVAAAAVGFASLSAVAGTASSGLALPLSTSAPCVSAVADAAAAGPMADADAFDSRGYRFSSLKTSISRKRANIVLHNRFPPSGFVLKPVWSVHMFLRQLQRTSSRPRP